MILLIINNKGKLPDKSIEIINEFYKRWCDIYIYRKDEIKIKNNQIYSHDKQIDWKKIDFLYINWFNCAIELIKTIENQWWISIVSSENYRYFMKHEQYLTFKNSPYWDLYPRTEVIKFSNKSSFLKKIKEKYTEFPIVIKTSIWWNWDWVLIAKNESELKNFTKSIKKDYLKYNNSILIQEFVWPWRWIDYRVTVVNKEIIWVMKRENKSSLKSNLAKWGYFEMQTEIPPKIQETIDKINEIFPDLIYYWADLIPHKNWYKISEINVVCNFWRWRVNLAPKICDTLINLHKNKNKNA